MSTRNAFSAYQAAIQTTPPLQAVVLLYDGVLVRIHNAVTAGSKGDFGQQFNEVMRATEILRGLTAAIDTTSGDFAVRLRETYEANMRAMMGAVGRPDASECLHRIAGGLRELRNAWAEIAGMPSMNTPSSAT